MLTRMWVDAQRDYRPAESRWRSQRMFRNFIHCTTPQSLADDRCSSAVQQRGQYRRAQDLDAKQFLHQAKLREGKCIYSVPAQETTKHLSKFGWLPLSDIAAATKPRRQSR